MSINSILSLPFEKARETEISKSSRKFFYENGYLIINNIIEDVHLLKENIPDELGQFTYIKMGSNEFMVSKTSDVEQQVPGSISRYNYPPYINFHTQIRLKLEKIIGEKLYNTYFYDRFYFANQELVKHIDRDSCEISISVQIGSNSDKPWEFCLRSLKGEEKSLKIEDGSGILYLGCDVLHWRNPLQSKYSKIKRKLYNIIKKPDDTYHHQIFFHYVRANGYRSHFANDKSVL